METPGGREAAWGELAVSSREGTLGKYPVIGWIATISGPSGSLRFEKAPARLWVPEADVASAGLAWELFLTPALHLLPARSTPASAWL